MAQIPTAEQTKLESLRSADDENSIEETHLLFDQTEDHNGRESIPSQTLTGEVFDCDMSEEGVCYHELSHNVRHGGSCSDCIKNAIGVTDSNRVSIEAIVTTSKPCAGTSDIDLHPVQGSAVGGGPLAPQVLMSLNNGSQASGYIPTSADSYRSLSQSFPTEAYSNQIFHCTAEYSNMDIHASCTSLDGDPGDGVLFGKNNLTQPLMDSQ